MKSYLEVRFCNDGQLKSFQIILHNGLFEIISLIVGWQTIYGEMNGFMLSNLVYVLSPRLLMNLKCIVQVLKGFW